MTTAPMHVVYINPNATQSMTDAVVQVAQRAEPHVKISGLTNASGPAAIQGAADGEAALPGVLDLVAQAETMGASAIVIACFDDTGLERAREAATCPVLGIGQSAYTMGALLGGGFCVVTSLAVSIPVIEENIEAQGFTGQCSSVNASDLPVLEIDSGSEAVRSKLSAVIKDVHQRGDAKAIVLGCAGMAPLLEDLARRTDVKLIDGVRSSAHLAIAAAQV